MIHIKNNKCCGCTACESVCPQMCINLVQDEEGFLYPEINQSICINCGLCEKVCPCINSLETNNVSKKGYIIRCKDEINLKKSTSGGFFSPLAEYILDNGGEVYAATYDKNFNIVHKKINDKNEMDDFRGSKYVQSNLCDCFQQIKTYLKENRYVLFVGTPCQVSGLKKYLSYDYKQLITVDFACHGSASPKIWDEYKKYQEKKYKSKIKKVCFRNKTYGYHSSTMKIEFNNNKVYYGSSRIDLFLKSFFSDLCLRPICYDCPFKSLDKCSDFTIFESWHAEKMNENIIDDNKGYTTLIVNSENGQKIFEMIEDLYYVYSIDYLKAVEDDGFMLVENANKPKTRDDFIVTLKSNEYKSHTMKFIKISLKDKILEKMKIILYKGEILYKLKKWVKKGK